MPYQVGKLYAGMAADDGVVTERTDKTVTVKYKSGETDTFAIGSKYGRMEGTVYPHEIVCELQTNNKFKKGDFISYNTGFFEKDWLDPTRLIMKFNGLANVAMTLTNEVYEDSSAVSAKFSEAMTSSYLKEKSFILDFKKNIIDLLPVGTEVEPNDVLFTIVDELTDYDKLSDHSIAMLQNLATIAPKAKYKGVIDKYELRYNGELQEMSPTFRKLTNKLDKELTDETKGTAYSSSSGKVSSEYLVSGKVLQPDTLELRVYIRLGVRMAVGDNVLLNFQKKDGNDTVCLGRNI